MSKPTDPRRSNIKPDESVWGRARLANIMLGMWLFMSAFICPHSPASRMNTWILGLVIAVIAMWASATAHFRWMNTVLSVWLFFSTLWIFHLQGITASNNVLVACGVFIFSLTPNDRATRLGK